MVLGVMAALASPKMQGILEARQLEEATQIVYRSFEQAQWLALTRGKTHKITLQDDALILEVGETSTEWESMPESISVDFNQWPKFYPSGFSDSATISLKSSQSASKVVVSTLGQIRIE